MSKTCIAGKNRRFTDYIYFLKIFQISNIRTKFKYVFFWGGGVTLLLSVKLLLSVAYYPKVTSLFLFISFPTCSIQMRARPLSSIAISVSRQIGFDSMYVYIKIQKLLWPLQNKGKDILSPEGRFYYCFLRQLTHKSRFFFFIIQSR